MDLTPKERAAIVAFRLAQGARLTSSQIAVEYQITYSGSKRLLNDLSRVIPIIRSDNGEWLNVDQAEADAL